MSLLVFFAACASDRARRVTRDAGVRSYLLSYAGGRQSFDINADVLADPACNLLVDSGAFSVWRAGTKIDIETYAAFCKELRDSTLCRARFVNLDVLPGRFGKRPTREERDESARRGWENYEHLKRDHGLPTLHVFHQHEDFEWLERLAEEDDYIGISPANDVSVEERDSWLDRVFARIGTRVRTHGFAVTATELLTNYPFYSADSTTWLNGAKYGSFVTFPRGRFDVVQIQRTTAVQNLHDLYEHRLAPGCGVVAFADDLTRRYELGARSFVELEERLTRLWAVRGVTWSQAFAETGCERNEWRERCRRARDRMREQRRLLGDWDFGDGMDRLSEALLWAC